MQKLPTAFLDNHPFAGKTLKRLYKYLGCQNHSHLSSLFVEGLLHHSFPSDFNDPFEAKPKAKMGTPSEARAQLIKVMNALGHPYDQIEGRATYMLRHFEQFEVLMDASIKDGFSRFVVSCFTEHKENLLMWSHYANSHQGICVEFNCEIEPIGTAVRVSYQQNYPIVKYPLLEDGSSVFPNLFVKSKHWEYESEYRTYNNLIGESYRFFVSDQFMRLPKEAITAVYFGCRTPEEVKDSIRSMIDGGPFSPEFYNAKQHSDEYRLAFSKCD